MGKSTLYRPHAAHKYQRMSNDSCQGSESTYAHADIRAACARLSFESSVVVLHLERGVHRDWRKSAMICKTANDFWVGEGECDPLGRDALASEFRSAFAAMAKAGAQSVVVMSVASPWTSLAPLGSSALFDVA
jgi:hypothetical protein